MSPFARSLYQIALEEGNTLTIETLRNAAFASISAGHDKTLSSFSINGKSSSFTVKLAASELFTAASWAIREYNTGTVTAIEFDFSRLY